MRQQDSQGKTSWANTLVQKQFWKELQQQERDLSTTLSWPGREQVLTVLLTNSLVSCNFGGKSWTVWQGY